MPEGEVTGADKGRTISSEEIVQKFIRLQDRLETESYEAVAAQAMKELAEYPGSGQMLYMYIQLLEGAVDNGQAADPEQVRQQISRLYKRLLEDYGEDYRQAALVSLFQHALAAKEYEKAQGYLDQITGPDEKDKLQARLFQEQGRTQEAYPLYEAIVYTAGMEALQGLQELRQLAMAEGD